MLHGLIKILSHSGAKNKTKRLKGFKFGTDFYWSFSNDNLAVKRLWTDGVCGVRGGRACARKCVLLPCLVLF